MESSVKTKNRVAAARVKRGAKWLDQNVPGWERRINVRTLDLENGSSCICGQVFKKEAKTSGHAYMTGFGWVRNNLFTEANSWVSTIVGPVYEPYEKPYEIKRLHRADRVAIGLGFQDGKVSTDGQTWSPFKGDRVVISFDLLQEAWLKLLRERKAAAKA
jgi:hypothetical protein